MSELNINERIKRFNEIEDEIDRLRTIADSQAGQYIDGYEGKNNNNNTALLIGFVIVLVCSALNIALGIISGVGLAFFIYTVSSSNTALQNNMNNTLSRIDALKDEQAKLDL